MNLILVEREEVRTDGFVEVGGEVARHLIEVLAATPGREVRVGVIDGPIGTAVVTSVGPGTVALNCRFGDAVPAAPRVDLLLALPRPKVMRRLWAQLAALGVCRIALTNAARVERPYFDTHVLSPTTYRPLLIEGLQQGRDTRVPEVSIHRQFRPLVEDDLDRVSTAAVRLLADPGLGPSPMDALGHVAPADRVLVAIGPEGGWNDFERRLLLERRFRPMSLGARTLRTDTAVVAVVSVVHEILRWLQPEFERPDSSS